MDINIYFCEVNHNGTNKEFFVPAPDEWTAQEVVARGLNTTRGMYDKEILYTEVRAKYLSSIL